jgi:hypothetical protein
MEDGGAEVARGLGQLRITRQMRARLVLFGLVAGERVLADDAAGQA